MPWKRNQAGGLEWAPDPVTPVSTREQPTNPYALPPLPSTGMSGLVPRPAPTPPTPPLQRYPLGTVPQAATPTPPPSMAPPTQQPVPPQPGLTPPTPQLGAPSATPPAPQPAPRDFSKTGFTVPLNQTNIHSPEERDAMQARINANPIQSPAQRQPAGVPTQQIPVGKSTLGQYVNDSPLAGVAMVNARYQLGAQASELEVKTLAKQTFGQLGQLIAAYDHPQAKDGADAALDLIARQAWYRQTGGQSGDPEAAPREYLESWKGAWRTGQEVPLGQELNAQLKSQGVEPQFARANVNAKMNQWGTLEQERQQQEATGTGIYAPTPPPPSPRLGSTPSGVGSIPSKGDGPGMYTRYATHDAGAGGVIDRSSPQGFLNSFVPQAQQALAAKGLSPSLAPILAAIPMNEQGWQTPAPGNNYYGIKGSNPKTGANTGPVGTWEDYGSGRENIQDTFRAYSSPSESVADFLQFLEDNSRYSQAMQIARTTGDPSAFIHAVHAAGYATDPAWATKILSIAGQVPRVPQPSMGAPYNQGR